MGAKSEQVDVNILMSAVVDITETYISEEQADYVTFILKQFPKKKVSLTALKATLCMQSTTTLGRFKKTYLIQEILAFLPKTHKLRL